MPESATRISQAACRECIQTRISGWEENCTWAAGARGRQRGEKAVDKSRRVHPWITIVALKCDVHVPFVFTVSLALHRTEIWAHS